jgi:hypothetical protein
MFTDTEAINKGPGWTGVAREIEDDRLDCLDGI